MSYDSRNDAISHKQIVRDNFRVLINDMIKRSDEHDNSKLKEPEKSGYDKYIPMLKEAKYGSTEYTKIRDEMQMNCLGHHYQVNRHHPEHFENGINDFTIIDLIEYFVDTYSASLKSDTPYEEGVKINAENHELPEELVNIFINTVNEYFPK